LIHARDLLLDGVVSGHVYFSRVWCR